MKNGGYRFEKISNEKGMGVEMEQLKHRINALKKEKDAVILAHYYVADEVQEVADYIGDSYYLSKLATEIPQSTICFAGVSFMGESAKILNPEKTVLLPDVNANCPMAYMASPEKIAKVREQYEDVAVVCYINSTAELKRYADVCVTSSNAVKIVKGLKNKCIYFIPDEHLGRFVAEQVPEKDFIFNDGYCHVHTAISRADVLEAKALYPGAGLLTHPECKAEVLELSDYIGSTLGIIEHAAQGKEKEFIICTEAGVLCELKKQNPGKLFHTVKEGQYCPDMKKITLEKIVDCLTNMKPEVEMREEERERAHTSLCRMLELAK